MTSEKETEESEDDSEAEQTNTRRVKEVLMRIPKIRRVGGKRTACIRKVETKYRVKVIIREKEVKVFADTGAEITVMSKLTADSLGLKTIKDTYENKTLWIKIQEMHRQIHRNNNV